MARMFEETTINGMTLKNRLVRSATWEGMCDENGAPTDRLIDYYTDLARGGVGLIISGYAYVSKEGQQFPGQMSLNNDTDEAAHRRLTDAVHQAGGKIAAQLVHCGGQANSKVSGMMPIAPSDIETPMYSGEIGVMSHYEIHQVIEAFGKAAKRAKAWGYDAIQLHGAHGYLISQFLSTVTNERTDEYGGHVDNRTLFGLLVMKTIRRHVGDDYPVLLKLNGSDFVSFGLSTAEAIVAARLFEEAGVNAIEVSGGTPASGDKSPVRAKINTPEDEAYNQKNAEAIKESITIPVMSVGGFRSYDIVEKALETVDYVSLSRPLVREPHLPNRWKSGDTARATCISCNGCFRPGLKEGGIRCVQEK